MIALKNYSAKTHQGPYLQVNEDTYDVDLVNNLFFIVDGFGGSGIGDKSALIVKDTIRKFYTKICNDPDSTLPFFYSYKYLLEGNAVINAMRYTHSLILNENSNKDMSQRGGASAIVAALAENILTFVSVGSCIAYLYHNGHLENIIFPDSMNWLSKDSYQRHFYTSPLSGFGLFEDIHLQVREVKISKDDIVILMTDGAYARLNEEELKYIVDKNINAGLKIDEMLKLSNTRGNLDNQTVLYLQF